jgi:hypothetical protein
MGSDREEAIMRFSITRTSQNRDFWNVNGRSITREYGQMRREAKAHKRDTRAAERLARQENFQAMIKAMGAKTPGPQAPQTYGIPTDDALLYALASYVGPTTPNGTWLIATQDEEGWEISEARGALHSIGTWLLSPRSKRAVRIHPALMDSILDAQADLASGVD